MSDSYMKDRARLHLMHKFSWLTLCLLVAGTAALSAAWGEGHLPNVLALWWAEFAVWMGSPKLPAIMAGVRFESWMILSSIANEPNHPFWSVVASHSQQLLAWLVASPILSVTILFSFQSWKKSRRASPKEVLEGTRVVDKKVYLKHRRKLGDSQGLENKIPITIDGIAIPEDKLPLSFALYGSPGSGKTSAINAFLTPIRSRGERSLVADVGGEALSGWFKTGDLIFSPFDARGVKWTPFAELRETSDVDLLAAALVGGSEKGEDSTWSGYAQELLAAIILRLFELGRTTNQDLIQSALHATNDELKELLQGTQVAVWFEGQGDKGGPLNSARFVLSARSKTFKYLHAEDGLSDSFSITSWVENDRAGWLWMPFREDQTKAMRPFLQLAFDLSAARLLSRDTDLKRRIWFMADEFSSLGRVDNLLELAAKGRKKGACIVAGIQTVAQVSLNFGRDGRDILANCLQNWAIFRTSDASTAKYLAELSGDQWVRRGSESTTESANGKSTTESTKESSEKPLSLSDIKDQEARLGYLKLAGEKQIVRIQPPVVSPPGKAPAFVIDERWKLRHGSRQEHVAAPTSTEPLQSQPEPAIDLGGLD